MTISNSLINTYTIQCLHPTKDLAYDVEVIAPSERSAVNRVTYTLFRKDQDVEWLDGTFEVTDIKPGVQYTESAGIEL